LSQPRLSFSGISHRFGPTEVLDGIGFDVRPGRFVAVIGPSGCGKSTLLQMATGLLRPRQGEVRRDGVLVAGVPPPSRRPGKDDIGLVPQQALLFPWKTLAENVGLKLELQGMAAAERGRRVAQALHDVGLEGFGDFYPRQLSGGMQKRGAIARTLVYDPSLILMDEPFGALDAQTRMVMQRDLQSLVARTRAAVLLVTHDITEAVILADEIVVLSRRPARLLAIHAVDLPRPRDPFEPHNNPGFSETYAKVWQSFRSEVERPSPSGSRLGEGPTDSANPYP
jgi:NitT/TauT family transport system ATP-binding protein